MSMGIQMRFTQTSDWYHLADLFISYKTKEQALITIVSYQKTTKYYTCTMLAK